jgi:excisionase family DNA binding protein
MKKAGSVKRVGRQDSRPEASARRQTAGSSADDAAKAKSKSKFLSPNEVADRLLVAPVTVRLWASKGLLPSVTTLGGHRRFREEDVEAFVLQHQRTTSQGVVAHRATPTSILIIDDDPQFARYLSGLVSARAPGVVLDIAHDGFSAGTKCQLMRPDIITLDLQMPDMNGFDVCMLLRSIFGKTKPRIVALTGFASKSNVERILAAGADVCVAKTAPAEALLKELAIPSFGNGKHP